MSGNMFMDGAEQLWETYVEDGLEAPYKSNKPDH